MKKRWRTIVLAGGLSVVLAIGSLALASAVGAGSVTPVASIDQMLEAIRRDTNASRKALTNKRFGLREIKREIRRIATNVRRLDVAVEVDERACAAVPVQCGNGATGHTFAPASSGNHNPVLIAVLVTRNGAPLPGLPGSGFDFSNRIVPAGGPGMDPCPAGGSGCAPSADVNDVGDGLYVLWAHPSPAGRNWKAGTYYARITVTDAGGRRGSALIEVVIP